MQKFKVYIATSLSNVACHNALRDALLRQGIELSYDWSVHGSVKGQGIERLAEVALAEMAGVRDADLVIGLLPGGKGTHYELGMAQALGKRVILFASRGHHQLLMDGDETCAFYHLPGTVHLHFSNFEITSWDDLAEFVFYQILDDLDAKEGSC